MSDAPKMTSPDGSEAPQNVIMCHRFQIPTTWAEPVVNSGPLSRGPQSMIMKQQMGFVPCIKDKCMLWNPGSEISGVKLQAECWDVTKGRMLTELTRLKWNEVMGSEE